MPDSSAPVVRWGVLGVARIATATAIPAFQAATNTRVTAIASRHGDKADAAAAEHGIDQAFGSYQALLAAPDIDAVYIPLPNHLHREWTIAALEAGKDVLCEKPLGVDAAEADEVGKAAARTGRRVMEGFMYRFHPQWSLVHDIVRAGRIGDVRLVVAWFSYPPNLPSNVRYVPGYGGGALLDVGCYCVNVARWVFGREPTVMGSSMMRGQGSGVDVMTSVLLDFGRGHAVVSCGMEQAHAQRVTITGTEASLSVPMPFNPRPDRSYDLVLTSGAGREAIPVPPSNQFTLEIEACSQAILDGEPFPYPVDDTVANLAVLDAIAAG